MLTGSSHSTILTLSTSRFDCNVYKKLEGNYTEEFRIDLASAAQLAALNPDSVPYRTAANRGAFVVSFLQGDIQESIYTLLQECFLDVLTDARDVYTALVADNPGAASFDFVSDPTGVSGAPHSQVDLACTHTLLKPFRGGKARDKISATN